MFGEILYVSQDYVTAPGACRSIRSGVERLVLRLTGLRPAVSTIYTDIA